MTTILVTGPTGNVGREVVKALPPTVTVRAADINPDAARKLLGDHVECVPFDFTRPETFAPALAGVTRLFLLRPPNISNVRKYITPAIEAAKQAGVQHIVFLSIQGVEQNRIVPHYRIEQAILAAGIPYTFLRASFFMQNLNTTHREEIRLRREISVPVGHARTSFIDVRDIGAVAARVLTEPGHENRCYTLTGSEALDYYQVTAIFSEVLGQPVRYANPSLLHFFRQQRALGRPAGFTLVMTGLYAITRFGNAAEVTPETAHLLQRPPISFRQYVEDYRSSWA
ncbi:MAG: SDR family oxidoreductase [Chloroflexi bacterium]|nr:SDR family oxidoreductase [Chloroflexota bacterium]